MFLTPILIIILSTLSITLAKVYERCELARELRNFDLPEDEIPTWVCIAHHESRFDTAAMNPGSGDHGLFQISQMFWCSPPGNGYGCNSPCSNFRDDDIADDLQCIRRIYNEHTRISGDGFNAWVVYPLYCKNDNSNFVRGCFDQELVSTPSDISVNATENEIPDEEVDEYGDGYQFPSLPTIAKTGQQNLSETIGLGDGYKISSFPYSKISIHDFVPATKDNTYNFPAFPFSKQSIHEFITVQRLSDESITTTIKDNKQYTENLFIKPVYSKHSIHHFFPVATTSTESINVVTKSDKDDSVYNFPPLPKISKETFEKSTDDFIPTSKLSEEEILGTIKGHSQKKYDYSVSTISSKDSIRHFVPVPIRPVESVMNVNKNTDYDKPEYNFSPSTKIPKKIVETSKLSKSYDIIIPPDLRTEKIGFKASSKLTTSQSLTQSNFQVTRQKNSTLKPPVSTKEYEPDKQPFYKETAATTTQKPFTRNLQFTKSLKTSTQSYSTTKKSLIIANKLFTTTTKPPTTKSSLNNITLEEVFPRFKSFNPITTSVATTLKPVTTTSNLPFFTSTFKPITNSLKPLIATLRPVTQTPIREKTITKHSLEDYDLQSASSTLSPISTDNPLTTTFRSSVTSKPLTAITLRPITIQKTPLNIFRTQTLTSKSLVNPYTNTSSKPLTSQKTSFSSGTQKSIATVINKPFTLPVKTYTTSTKKPLVFQSLTTFKPLSNFTGKLFSQSVSKQFYTTTSKPLSKQLTFAPDSFFSWIFGSQTLPPLVPPVRPPRPTRPSGERPGGLPLPSTIRPRPDRPGSLPRPPRPERPGGIRPAIEPDVLFGPASTRRPFGHRPAGHMRPFSFKQQPGGITSFTRKSLVEKTAETSTVKSLEPFNTVTPKIIASKEIVPSQNKVSVHGNARQFPTNVYEINSVATRKPPSNFGISGFEPNLDKSAVEVKLDDNFVFFRTKFGYRLFRNNKN